MGSAAAAGTNNTVRVGLNDRVLSAATVRLETLAIRTGTSHGDVLGSQRGGRAEKPPEGAQI